MIPSVLVAQIQKGIEDFLRSTYPITTPGMEHVLDDLFQPGSLFKGPYLSIDLPFLTTAAQDKSFFEALSLHFAPYVHQQIAFERLTDEQPRSTIVATGTGSGKTECFLYPLLEYCYQHRDDKGIKAIIIYPMNALATDQARRIAKTIASAPTLQGKIRAGLFVGELESEPRVVMGSDMIITDKSTLRQSPPDILLTNYKMLDYMLVRPGDMDLWKLNRPDTLKFLIVDELHTFDGAQGTDLACLIRRLKSRLRTPESHLCCIGTSATLGSEGKTDDLIKFGQDVFGEPLDAACVIKEYRQSLQEYLAPNSEESSDVPLLDKLNVLDHASYVNYQDYLKGVYSVWFPKQPPPDFQNTQWPIKLGVELKQHKAFRTLLALIAGKPTSYVRLCEEFAQRLGITDSKDEYASRLVDSLVALISHARSAPGSALLNVRLQLWLRELKRVMAEVNTSPALRFSDDLTADQRKTHLPLVYCDDCGATAWAGLTLPERKTFQTDLRAFYDAFFGDNRNVRFVYPVSLDEEQHVSDRDKVRICIECLRIHHVIAGNDTMTCHECGSEQLLLASMPNIEIRGRNKVEISRDCPICTNDRQVRLVGAQAANLSGVVVSNLFTSPWNRDKRLIAFSDSVQDASHRAGFIKDRSSHITFRTALQKYLDKQKPPVVFNTLAEDFLSHLFNQDGESQTIGKFLHIDLEFHEDFETIKTGGTIPADSSLKFAFETRIHWDVFMEYGPRARIGRTLEKSGASVAQIEPGALAAAIHDLYETYINEDGNFRKATEEDVAGFVTGLLTHLKLNGGIFQDFLLPYVNAFGNPFAMRPRFVWEHSKIKAHPPRYFTDGRTDRSTFEQILGSAKENTWTHQWLLRCFGEIGGTLLIARDKLYELALRSLIKFGIVREERVGQNSVWGLTPEKLLITTSVASARCSNCKHELAIGGDEVVHWKRTRCLRKGCIGFYVVGSQKSNDYYRMLFTRGDVLRIVPAEHTGLLERDTREEVEKAFIDGKHPWDPNVLSATSTLEMGIDIGDLSAVLLCSVPPSQANYLQRIGRAGRRDGNSLAVTVANGRPHDLFFFSAPEEMIAGAVRAPGLFLNASAILERQLTAYCFDQWVATGVTDAEFPPQLQVVLNNIDKRQPSSFPFNWMQFVNDNRATLLSSFLKLFQQSISEDTKAQLTAFFNGSGSDEGSLLWRVINGLEELAKERSSTRKKLSALDRELKEKKKNPVRDESYEQELEDLQNEKSGLQEIVSRINKKATLEFFTDEGFIPNYAFPETGVTLRSVIYRKRERKRSANDDQQFQYWTFSYERPSSAAISELAPANFFYAEGRKVRIDQINMDLSELQWWRLCRNCSHCQRIIGNDDGTNCPACGDCMWMDAKQKKQMIRLRQVIATTSAAKSTMGEEKEERTPAFFNKQLLVSFDRSYLKNAYSLDDDSFPFGFEYSSKTTFREINSGQKDATSEQIYIAGIQSPRKGFHICQECGKVQEPNSSQQVHTFTCTARSKSADKNLIELMYLYREFTSEAIRILLPATTFTDSDQLVHSFVAAFQMGLRDVYGGKVDHLSTTIYEEPIPGTIHRKRYVVIYDTVPGGTGYLKELSQSADKMTDLLTKALDKLNSCSCNLSDPAASTRPKDGCYRCLFAYRNSYDMPKTSRENAKLLLSEIVSRKHLLNRVDTLSSVQVSALLDSELERLFLQRLGEVRLSDGIVSLVQEVVNGKPGYHLRIGDRSYDIEPQVSLGSSQGVLVESRADFVFYPRGKAAGAKPIVVFVDGYEFHHNRIALDLQQRTAIARSGNYSVWSIAWDDVDARATNTTDFYFDFLSLGANAQVISKRKTFAGALKIPEFIDFYRHESFRLFLEYLRNPDSVKWQSHSLLIAMGFLDGQHTEEAQQSWITSHEIAVANGLREAVDVSSDGGRLLGKAALSNATGDNRFEIFISVPQASVQNLSSQGLYIAAVFDSEDNRPESERRKEWVGMLRMYNLLNFLPDCFFMTKTEVTNESFQFIPLGRGLRQDTSTQAAESQEWREVFKYADPETHSLLEFVQGVRGELPEVGADILGPDNAVIVTGELVWTDQKIALILGELTPIAQRQLQSDGWAFGDLAAVRAEFERRGQSA